MTAKFDLLKQMFLGNMVLINSQKYGSTECIIEEMEEKSIISSRSHSGSVVINGTTYDRDSFSITGCKSISYNDGIEVCTFEVL